MNQSLVDISAIETLLGYCFSHKKYLLQAFIHTSYLNESTQAGLESNERLEFLGDSVLHLYVSQYLFSTFPTLPEGTLSQYKAALICQNSCASMLKELQVLPFLLTGKGEMQTIHSRPSISSDLFEAIIGAIFLDAGYEKTAHFLHTHFSSFFEQILSQSPKNPKVYLQELCAQKLKTVPEYKLLEISGPCHERLFTVGVFVQEKLLGTGQGKSKREAEFLAAQEALLSFENAP